MLHDDDREKFYELASVAFNLASLVAFNLASLRQIKLEGFQSKARPYRNTGSGYIKSRDGEIVITIRFADKAKSKQNGKIEWYDSRQSDGELYGLIAKLLALLWVKQNNEVFKGQKHQEVHTILRQALIQKGYDPSISTGTIFDADSRSCFH